MGFSSRGSAWGNRNTSPARRRRQRDGSRRRRRTRCQPMLLDPLACSVLWRTPSGWLRRKHFATPSSAKISLVHCIIARKCDCNAGQNANQPQRLHPNTTKSVTGMSVGRCGDLSLPLPSKNERPMEFKPTTRRPQLLDGPIWALPGARTRTR